MSETQGDPKVPFQATYVAERDSRITSCCIPRGGKFAYVGIAGGTVETCEVTRQEETVYCNTILRKPLLKSDDARRLAHVSSMDLLVVWTRDGSLCIHNMKLNESKTFLKHCVVAVSVDEDGCIAVLRTGPVSKALRATVYRIEEARNHSVGLKLLWESHVDVQTKGNISTEASIASIKAPWSLIVCVEQTFLWVGFDERTRHGGSRVVFVNDSISSLNRVLHVSGRGEALMLAGDLGIIVNREGEPIGDSLDLIHHRSPMKILDAAIIESNLVLLTDNAMRIIDIDSRGEVFVPLAELPSAPWSIGVPGTDEEGQPLIPIFTSSSLWLVCAISYRDRIQRALEERNAELALQLIQHHGISAPGYMEFLVRCGILFIELGNIRRGIGCIEQCPSEIFEPAELFPLFPEYMKTFMASGRDASRLRIHSSLQSIWERNGCTSMGGDKKAQDLQDILEYLFRVREFPTVGQKDGIDSLILHILIDLDLKEAADAFLSSPNNVSVDQLHQRVKSKKDWTQCLARLLGSDARHVETTLGLWRQLAEESSNENKCDALEAIERILSNQSACDSACVVNNITWLMDRDAEATLRVLQMRTDVTATDILDTISDNECKCRFLQIAVQVEENRSNEYLHTELALALLEEISSQDPSCFSQTFASCTSDSASPAMFLAEFFSGGHKKSDRAKIHSLRSSLHQHLVVHAEFLNMEELFAKIPDTMIPEKAIVASLRSDHETIISILVDLLGNGPVAIEYARKFLPHDAHPMLLDHIMKSDKIMPWEIAGNIIASFERHSFDPTAVMMKMPDDMELNEGLHSLSCMIQSMFHKKREHEMRKAIYQNKLLTLKSRVMEKECDQPCVIVPDTTCRYCSLKIGSKVCVVIKAHDDGPHVACLHCFNQIKNN
ncbi:hypothetical protein M9434_005122 [Picochlorum sp. BPE23]|nr:hypothetical protein M9434_005122 [Picochlorum sp. BPE23]